MTEHEKIEDNLTEHVAGYGLTLNDEKRMWWQPRFEIVALVHVCAGQIHLDQKTEHISWHWTFRQGRDRLNVLHGQLVTSAMQEAWYGSMVRDPDGPPIGFEGTGL